MTRECISRQDIRYTMKPDGSNGQRALWSVLITSLAAPFFAGIAVALLALIGQALGFAIPPQFGASLGEAAVGAFAWGAFPATVSAIGLTPFVLEKGSYGWLEAAVAGVLAFAVSQAIFPIAAGGALPVMAFCAGLLAVFMRLVLISGGILRG